MAKKSGVEPSAVLAGAVEIPSCFLMHGYLGSGLRVRDQAIGTHISSPEQRQTHNSSFVETPRRDSMLAGPRY